MSHVSPSTQFRGFVAKAMAQAYDRRDPHRDVSGTFQCPRCHSTLNFTTLSNGLSRGQCLSSGCVRWVQ